MGSVENSNPWAPYGSYRDCSQGICSRFCPQFCYLIFPPPPLDDDSGTPFSPLIIAIIGVLASAFILVSYYTIVTRFCKRRNDHSSRVENQENRDEIPHDQWQVASTGLDEALIRTITVCKYKKGDGLIEGTECAVCLSEFEEDELLRLLPKCNHAFHLPCIDTWLKSHSNCPLCRANVVSLAQPSPPSLPSFQTSSALNTNTYEFQPPNDLILVVDNQEMDCRERVVVRFVNDDDNEDEHDVSPKSPIQLNLNTDDPEIMDENTGNDEESTVRQIKRPISLGTFSCQSHPIISDVLKIEESDEDLLVKCNQSWRGIGCSKGSRDLGLMPSPVSKKRSISSGKFTFTIHDKGKNSMLPD